LIVVSADHGEAFGERGFEGHARNVYGEVTEVPFLIAFPFKLEPGVVVRTRTENVDVWPTLLDLLGLPPLAETDGRSRMPEIRAAARGAPQPPEEEALAFAQLDQTWGRGGVAPAPMVAVASGPYRYVRSTAGAGREELFHGGRDEKETEDVAAESPGVVERLRSAASAYLDARPPSWAAEARTVELDEMEKNQLRALGYAVP
jgi:arylsulfatase A-like enzyme